MEQVWVDLPAARSPSTAEAALIVALATATGAPSLVEQANSAQVVSDCVCRCRSVRLSVEGPLVPPDVVQALSGVGRDDYCYVRASFDKDGSSVAVVLHVLQGRISELEVYAGHGVSIGLPTPDRLGELTTG